ncbi:hypothetical protein [Nostoc sp.]|uniref:hypothetical protein n=1 Tax=Nostoc sp. TaxID=1180 RepID=UPI002FF6E496
MLLKSNGAQTNFDFVTLNARAFLPLYVKVYDRIQHNSLKYLATMSGEGRQFHRRQSHIF